MKGCSKLLESQSLEPDTTSKSGSIYDNQVRGDLSLQFYASVMTHDDPMWPSFAVKKASLSCYNVQEFGHRRGIKPK